MTSTIDCTQPPPRKNYLDKRWILTIIILLMLLVVAARMVTPTHSSNAPIVGNVLVTPSLTPPATATATAIATAESTSTPAATKTATATATSTNTPTPSSTAATSSSPEAWGKVLGYSVKLRTGPDGNYPVVRKLIDGEPLMLLGRLSNSTWLYVKTSDNQEGWVITTLVDLAGVNVDYQAIKTPSPPETTFKIYGGPVNLRAGPSPNFPKLQKLSYGEQLMLKGRLSDNSWLYVETTDGQEGWIDTAWTNLGENQRLLNLHPAITPPPTQTATPVILEGIEGRWIDIDLSEQKLFAYDGTRLEASFLVSTGIYKYPTETGQFHIDVKWRYSDMRGDDYFLPDVPYTMYYYGDYSIHGTYWHHSFGQPMSHGCINMDTKDAEWLFNWASVGTLVNIHR